MPALLPRGLGRRAGNDVERVQPLLELVAQQPIHQPVALDRRLAHESVPTPAVAAPGLA